MFTGIPLAALDFYEDLEADNSKTWWLAHKNVYDNAIKAPITEWMAELEPDFGPAKVFRHYRDVRFSKDKTPYKTAQGAFVGSAPGLGYYLQIDASGLYLGGGYHHSATEQVTRYRAAVDDAERGAELEEILGKLTKAKFTVGGEQLKKTPRGFAPDHPRAELLRHKSLTVGKAIGAPKWLETPRAAKEIKSAWLAIRPLVDWLDGVVNAP